MLCQSPDVRKRSQLSILIVDDDLEEHFLVARMLKGRLNGAFHLEAVTTCAEMASKIASDDFDAVLLDLHLENDRGVPLIETCLETCRDLPVIVRTGNFEDDTARRALQLGVQDFVSKDDQSAERLERTILYAIERMKNHTATARLAFTDHLTGIGNRHHLERTWEHLKRQPVAFGSELVLYYFDINGLKHINDSLGHTAGDILIRTIARRLHAGLGKIGAQVFRIGGDEMCALCGPICAERADEILSPSFINCLKSQVGRPVAALDYQRPSIALGASRYDMETLPPLEAALQAADRRMYQDKSARKRLDA